MRGLAGLLLVFVIIVGAVIYLIIPHLVANNRSNAEIAKKLEDVKTAIENISFGEVKLENITLELGEIYAYILNQSLPVYILNQSIPVEARVVNALDVYVRNNYGVWILNNSLPVSVLNSLLDVRVTNNPGVYILNNSIPVTGTVNIGNTPISTQVVNTPLDVRVSNSVGVNVLNSSLAVYFSPPVRYYYVAHLATSAVGASKVHLCVWNGNTSLVLYVPRIIIASEVTGAVSGFQIVFRIQRITGISGGTAVTIVPWDTANPSLVNVVATTTPTISGATTLFSVALNQEETGGDIYQDIILDNYPIPIRPNQGLCVVQYGTAGTGSVSIAIVFYIQP